VDTQAKEPRRRSEKGVCSTAPQAPPTLDRPPPSHVRVREQRLPTLHTSLAHTPEDSLSFSEFLSHYVCGGIASVPKGGNKCAAQRTTPPLPVRRLWDDYSDGASSASLQGCKLLHSEQSIQKAGAAAHSTVEMDYRCGRHLNYAGLASSTLVTECIPAAKTLAGVLFGLGLLAVWIHHTPGSMDQRQNMIAARGSLQPLSSAPARPRGGGMAPSRNGTTTQNSSTVSA
jgi:hypothetical protein